MLTEPVGQPAVIEPAGSEIEHKALLCICGGIDFAAVEDQEGQHEDCQGAGVDDPAVPTAALGSAHRIVDRRRFLQAVSVSFLAAPHAVEAQQAVKIPRIGYLSLNQAATPQLHEAFRQGLRDLGYVDGRNIVSEYRDAEGKPERLPALAAELAALKVDVIVVSNTPAALAVKQKTRTIPIVFLVGDPISTGLVTSLARPGGNLTGVSTLAPDLVGKCLELLKEAAPRISQVAVLWQPDSAAERTEVLKQAESVARALSVQLHFVEARGLEDLDKVLSEVTRLRANALAVLPYAIFVNERKRVVDLAAKARLPAVYAFRESVNVGGLMSYGPDLRDMFRRLATYVDKILKGAKPADLPIQQPTKFELIINLKAAKTLGLTIPQSVLERADQVID